MPNVTSSSPRRKRMPRKPSNLVVPPADYGSLGDQALVLALERELKAAGQEIALAEPSNGWEAICRIAPKGEFPTFDRLYVIGADVVDGSYGFGHLAEQMFPIARSFGSRAIVCSFSFRSDPDPQCVAELQDLHACGVRFAVRDPHSHRRFGEVIGPSVLSSDLSFLLPARGAPEVEAFAAKMRLRGKKLIGVNINALVSSSGIDDFARRLLTHRDWAFVVSPHDFRERCCDVPACAELARRLGAHCLLWKAAHAADVKAACKSLDVVLTGRMHVAAAALSVGTPAIAIDYNDKTKGLFTHFECPELALTPYEFFIRGDGIANDLLMQRTQAIRAQIVKALPEITRLARQNLFL